MRDLFRTYVISLLALLACATPAWGQAGSCGLEHQAKLDQQESNDTLMPRLGGPFADAAMETRLENGYRLYFVRHRLPAAEKTLQAALDLAVSKKNRCAEGLAAFGLGLSAEQNDAASARKLFQQAATAFEDAHSQTGLAHAHYGLARVTFHDLSEAKASALFTSAAGALEQAGESVDAIQARAEAVIPTSADAPAEFAQLASQAHALGSAAAEALIYHDWGDAEFSLARYDQALIYYKRADSLYASCRCGPTQRAYVQTSMGRLERVQGRPRVSIAHYRLALHLQALGHDQSYMPQTLNAISVAYEAMHRYAMAIVYEKHALAYARSIHSQQFIDFLEPNLGYLYFQAGQPKRGLPLLERAVARTTADYRLCIRYDQLAEIYLTLRLQSNAEDSITRGVSACESAKDSSGLADALETRARIRRERNELDGALTDARQSLALVEQIRAHLVPEDAHKRGYNEATLDLYETSIAVLARMDRFSEALDVTEQSRARAFLDLLSSPRPSIKSPGAVAPHRRPSLRRTSSLRGGDALAMDNETDHETLIESAAHVQPMHTDEMVAVAARLHSTIVAYWISKTTLYIWVVRSGHPVYGIAKAIRPGEIERLVRAANPFAASTGARGITARGGETLAMGPPNREVWKRLHALLIQPVAAELPNEPGSLLTIVPYGPLFQLPFAALVDRQGHYLVERYALHTVPAVGLLAYTEKNEAAAEKLVPHYLFVANPQHLPQVPGEDRLPPLPGTDAEVKAIAQTLPSSEVTLLEGGDADKAHLFQALPQATVLHFATHAIVSDSDPFDSFLALDSRAAQGGDNGLLTTASIYGMRLHTLMVVLSACRTGRGPISGDGVAGLSRAFFYAGSASVLTTMWDVADAPTAALMPLFYKGLERGESRANSLRDAQLALIQQLRQGRIKVWAGGKEFALPERPVFWAAFSLSGQP